MTAIRPRKPMGRKRLQLLERLYSADHKAYFSVPRINPWEKTYAGFRAWSDGYNAAMRQRKRRKPA